MTDASAPRSSGDPNSRSRKGSGAFQRTLARVVGAGMAGCFLAGASASPQRIVVIGDSTVCNYAASKYPWAGWGQVLSLYFKAGTVSVDNRAIGGRSSRSFIEDGHWASTLASLQKGDILLVQFGHNDRDFSKAERYTDTAAYKTYLGQYAREAREAGALPVFVTPMNMNTWNGQAVREVFTEGANNYRAAMIHAGADLKVPVLDLERKSKLLMDTLGQAYMTKFHFMGLDTGEYANYPDGASDGTHFQEMGSQENARMLVEEILRQSSDSTLGRLAPLAASLVPVVVQSNLSNGGVLTRSRVFPPGATVTLKVKPAAGKVFLGWADETGTLVSTAQRYTFVQTDKSRTFTARFQGGSTSLGSARPPELPRSAPEVDALGRIVTAQPKTSPIPGLGHFPHPMSTPATSGESDPRK